MININILGAGKSGCNSEIIPAMVVRLISTANITLNDLAKLCTAYTMAKN